MFRKKYMVCGYTCYIKKLSARQAETLRNEGYTVTLLEV